PRMPRPRPAPRGYQGALAVELEHRRRRLAAERARRVQRGAALVLGRALRPLDDPDVIALGRDAGRLAHQPVVRQWLGPERIDLEDRRVGDCRGADQHRRDRQQRDHRHRRHHASADHRRSSSEREPRPRRAPGQGLASPQNYGYRKGGVSRRSTVTTPKGVTVTRTSVREYLAKQRERYQQLARRDRSRLLTEIVAVTGYHRKAVLRSLSVLPRRRAGRRPVGRPRRYGADVARVAQVLWQAAGQIGATRLQPFVPALRAPLAACCDLSVSAATTPPARPVSTATLERLLAPARRLAPRPGRSTTQPGGWLKQQIPIRTFAEWDDARPGFLEVDLVAHCGE